MWELPIVASDWRGNRDVLTSEAGAIVFPVSAPFVGALANALQDALDQGNCWTAWGEQNRALFERKYKEKAKELWLARAVLAIDSQTR